MSFFKGFKKGMESFGSYIVVIINSTLLAIVYIIGVGVTSIVAKLAKKKFLEIKTSDKKTYWENLNLKKEPIDNYYRQF